MEERQENPVGIWARQLPVMEILMISIVGHG